MKIKFQYILFLFFCAATISCKKDNYAPPSAVLKGRLVYNGDSIGVESGHIPFQLYQYGFGKIGAINGNFAQDGSYSALLFDGNYKFIIPNNLGPFLYKKSPAGNPDSLSITVKGSQVLDIQVIPYYMIRTPRITGNASTVTATCRAEKIITDPALAQSIEKVSLYINLTQFISVGHYIAVTDLAGASITDLSNISLSVNVPAYTPAQNYVYARIGLKITGVQDAIYSPVQKIQF